MGLGFGGSASFTGGVTGVFTAGTSSFGGEGGEGGGGGGGGGGGDVGCASSLGGVKRLDLRLRGSSNSGGGSRPIFWKYSLFSSKVFRLLGSISSRSPSGSGTCVFTRGSGEGSGDEWRFECDFLVEERCLVGLGRTCGGDGVRSLLR